MKKIFKNEEERLEFKNSEKIRHSEYRKNNSEKIGQYYLNNRERCLKNAKEYYEKNKDNINNKRKEGIYKINKNTKKHKNMIERLKKLDLKIEKAKELCRVERIKLIEKVKGDKLGKAQKRDKLRKIEMEKLKFVKTSIYLRNKKELIN